MRDSREEDLEAIKRSLRGFEGSCVEAVKPFCSRNSRSVSSVSEVEGIESFLPLLRSFEVVGLMEKWEERRERKEEMEVEGGKERGRFEVA